MKTKPRLLSLSATSGAGHVRAAQALEKTFLRRAFLEPIPGKNNYEQPPETGEKPPRPSPRMPCGW